MALDVYVGSLTRYYAGAWENPMERAARERGLPQPVRPSGHAKAATSQARIHTQVLAWRSTLAAALGKRIRVPLDWDETDEARWFTG